MRRTKRGVSQYLAVKRRLRLDMTPPERNLWSKLRSRQFGSLKFRRQHGIGPYIVDFFCPEVGVVVEVDGDSHAEERRQAHDEARGRYFESLGLRVIRYNNRDILRNIEGVLEDLSRKLSGVLPPPAPPYKGGE